MFHEFTDEEKANARPLEPTTELSSEAWSSPRNQSRLPESKAFSIES